jgi:hypothetical protein
MTRKKNSPSGEGKKSHAEVYESIYSNLMSQGLVGFMAKVLHTKMEKPYRRAKRFGSVLEIGAGGG